MAQTRADIRERKTGGHPVRHINGISACNCLYYKKACNSCPSSCLASAVKTRCSTAAGRCARQQKVFCRNGYIPNKVEKTNTPPSPSRS